MPLDIVIFKQGKEKEYVSIDEKLHLLMFSQDAIKQGRCRELSKIKDYYLTDVIFMGKTLTNFVEDLRMLSLSELSPIIKLLEQTEIEKIRISGD